MEKGYKLFFKLAVLILNIFLMLFLVNCSKKEEDRVIKIGVTVSNFEDTFLTYVRQAMENHQKNLGDNVEVVYLDAKMSVEKQEGQVKYFIEEGIDSLVVLPVDTEFTSTITEMAKKAGIPIVYGNNFPDEFRKKRIPKGVYFVGPKEKETGMLQMEYLAEKLGGKGNVAILMGRFDHLATFERTEGVEEVANKYPGINIVEKGTAKWLRPLATSVVEEWLNSGEKIDAIIANNDEMAIGAIIALEEQAKLNDILVVGLDGTDDAIEELKLGKLAATVYQPPSKHGEKLLDTAFKVANGEKVENEIWIPFNLITRENYKDILTQ